MQCFTFHLECVRYVWCARQAGCLPQGGAVLIQSLSWLQLSKEPCVSSPDEVYQTKNYCGQLSNSIFQSASVSPGIDLRTAKVTVRVWTPKEEEKKHKPAQGGAVGT